MGNFYAFSNYVHSESDGHLDGFTDRWWKSWRWERGMSITSSKYEKRGFGGCDWRFGISACHGNTTAVSQYSI